jgi:D-alanyl-lipoteichoic acid acyltransferase DltB (MBOAT superfamily)
VLFNSLNFLIFFPIVTIGYFWLPYQWRWLWLLVASCVFYMAFVPIYILILVVTIVVDYFAGLLIERTRGRERRRYLVTSIIVTCAVLFVFKYYNFFGTNVNWIADEFNLNFAVDPLALILPIGLSFHTFQSLSYVIEVYRGNQKAERHFGIYSLYVMFYPQLVAGPIERPQNLLHQLREKHPFEYRRVADGLKLMAWGLFKKVVIADRLAVVVNTVYADPTAHSGGALLLAAVFFAFQIYCDFSGYSDMAIGAAQVMGIRLMENFRRPFASRSVSELWTRWHISLSLWFRDYVYIPLGGNRVGRGRFAFNIMATFLLSGLWHGANWTFLLWGGLNGLFIVVGNWTRGFRDVLASAVGFGRLSSLRRALQVLTVFSLFVLSFIVFRAASIGDAWYIVTHLFHDIGSWGDLGYWRQTLSYRSIGLADEELRIAFFSILALELVQAVQSRRSVRAMLATRHWALRWTLYLALVWAILTYGMYTQVQPFIYFQF